MSGPLDGGDDDAVRRRLLTGARLAIETAYAPYSRFRVGSALLTRRGNLYTACNVENRSYGLTICAERAAVAAAVAAEGPGTAIQAVAVLSHPEQPCSPCGACRQVLAEFGPGAIVFYRSRDGIVGRPLTELLVDAF
jgi:cytidine deaminase